MAADGVFTVVHRAVDHERGPFPGRKIGRQPQVAVAEADLIALHACPVQAQHGDAAKSQYNGHAKRPHDIDQRKVSGANRRCIDISLAILIVDACENGPVALLLPKSLDDAHPHDALFDVRGHAGHRSPQ